MDHASRVARLQDQLDRQLLVTSLPNIRYLLGFTGSLGFAVVDSDSFVFITDGRYGESSGGLIDAIPGAELIVHSGGLNTTIAKTFTDNATVDLEAAHISWDAMRALAGATSTRLEPSVGVVEDLRRIKTADEVGAVRAACAAGDAAFDELETIASTSATEGELGWGLIDVMRGAGAGAAAWPPIVAIGEHASVPHHRSGTGKIAEGLLLLDYGCEVEGYHSDMSRTVWRGSGSDTEMDRVYEAVRESQQAGVDAVRPGAVAGAIDAACRAVLDRYGYLDYFLHSTGHGVGLEIHEGPWIRTDSEDVLEPGNIITIEPGVYLSGRGGVRIEDTVVVTDTGCENLTLSHKEFHLA